MPWLPIDIMDRWLSQGLPRKRCVAPLTDKWTRCYSCCLLSGFSESDSACHHSPYKAGKFPGNCSNRYISFFPMADHPVILALKSCVCSVSICNDISCISVLPAAQFLGFMSDLSLADSFCPFNEKRTKMTVASF